MRRAFGTALLFVAIGVAVSACGRRGDLEPPPSATSTQTQTPQNRSLLQQREARRVTAVEQEARLRERERERAEHPYGEDWPYPPREKVIDVDERRLRPGDDLSGTPQPRKRQFFLDPLID